MCTTHADWTSAGLKGKEDTYTLQFSEADTAELIKAVDKIKARGVASEEDVKKVGHSRVHAEMSACRTVLTPTMCS